jgi:hypothetical protein
MGLGLARWKETARMARQVIEIMTPFASDEALQRLKLDQIIKLAGDQFVFRNFGDGGEQTRGIIINILRVDLDINAKILSVLKHHRNRARVTVFLADLYAELIGIQKK